DDLDGIVGVMVWRWWQWCCDGGGMIRGDDVDGCGGGRRQEWWPEVGRKDGEAPENMRGGRR
ncbi:hypothetical protein Tco_1323948, partial [Tanacetum coccineum]